MASEAAFIKLSELSLGIGPFVIAPAVDRKIGLAALSELSLNPTEWKNAHWAKEKGLYSEVFESIQQLDEAVDKLSDNLASYNPKALEEMKKTFWEGTEHWENLLFDRAKISGELVLSVFTKNALNQFKKQ